MSVFFAGAASLWSVFMFFGYCWAREPIGAALWAAALTMMVRYAWLRTRKIREIEQQIDDEEDDDGE